MGAKELGIKDLRRIAHKVFKYMIDEMEDEEKTTNVADVICVIGILHRMTFACVERDNGIEKARELTGFMVDLVESTLEEGAWDDENKRMK